MSSIVIHIRFTDETLAKMVDGIEFLGLPPPATMNDIVRTAALAGLSMMRGPDWEHNPPSHAGMERIRSLTKQPVGAKTSDQITEALKNKLIRTENVWDKIDICKTIETLPGSDSGNAYKIWDLMEYGHIPIPDQLTCNDGTVDRLASFLLWHHKEHFPEDLPLIEQVYNEYWKGD